ncbi:MAG TPA: BON domain-containing protein [Actinomycetota bacterium]|nr:BON domain-containing protein [Actinomycetota bacterium]
MNTFEGEPDTYIIQHVREKLALDGGELDIHVRVNGDTVLLTGSVATEERKAEAARVVETKLPDHRVVNDLDVVEVGGPKTEPIS